MILLIFGSVLSPENKACAERLIRNPEQVLAAARNAAEDGSFVTAESLYSQVLRSYPRNPEAQLGLVWSKRLQGDFVAAQRELARGLENFPQYPPLLLEGAYLNFVQRRYLSARSLYERYARLTGTGTGRLGMAWCDYYLGRLRTAAQEFGAVLQKDPENTAARQGRGLVGGARAWSLELRGSGIRTTPETGTGNGTGMTLRSELAWPGWSIALHANRFLPPPSSSRSPRDQWALQMSKFLLGGWRISSVAMRLFSRDDDLSPGFLGGVDLSRWNGLLEAGVHGDYGWYPALSALHWGFNAGWSPAPRWLLQTRFLVSILDYEVPKMDEKLAGLNTGLFYYTGKLELGVGWYSGKWAFNFLPDLTLYDTPLILESGGWLEIRRNDPRGWSWSVNASRRWGSGVAESSHDVTGVAVSLARWWTGK